MFIHSLKPTMSMFFLVGLLLSIPIVGGEVPDEQSKVRMFRLHHGYNNNVPPRDGDKPTELNIDARIMRIAEVDEYRREVEMDIMLRIYWLETRVSVNESFLDKENLDKPVSLDADVVPKFWFPDLYIRQMKNMNLLQFFYPLRSMKLSRDRTVVYKMSATVKLHCEMDFTLYPLDRHECKMDFASFNFANGTIRMSWRKNTSPLFKHKSSTFALPQYVVQFSRVEEPINIKYVEDYHCVLRVIYTLSRRFPNHLLDTYLPSTIFVVISWISFAIPNDVIPGRMVLLVTTLLTLVTHYNSVRATTPQALGIKCVEVWLMSCVCFVFMALIEYALLLIGQRYETTLRKVYDEMALESDDEAEAKEAPQEGKVGVVLRKRDKVYPATKTSNGKHEQGRNTRANRQFMEDKKTMRFRWLRNPEKGELDSVAIILFPFLFLVFNIAYWTSYGTASSTTMHTSSGD